MADKVSYKMVKNWLENDNLYSIGLFKLEAYNGYYYIKAENGNTVVCSKTPKELWNKWDIFKAGYMLGKYNRI